MATESIIDRAALAASGAFGYAPSLVDDPEVVKSLGPNELSGDDWRNVVRAVLTAIREPSEAMVQAGNRSKPYNVTGFCEGKIHPVVQRAWPAMIDAALAEGK